MSLFSKLSSFVRKKQKKTPPNGVDGELAKDVLEAGLEVLSVQPEICVTSNNPLNHSTQLMHMALVQGSSDSKPVNGGVRKYGQPKQISSKYHHQNITPNAEITRVQPLHRAPISEVVNSNPRLYPVLQSSSTDRDSSSVKKKSIEVLKLASIHDITAEILFQIQPKILHAITIKTGIDQLKNDAKSKVLKMRNMLQNSLNLEYTFNKEINAVENYSYVKVYEKMNTFDDVRSCHQRVNQPNLLNISNDPKAAPIFQSYRQKFRCYKGCKNDIIDCN